MISCEFCEISKKTFFTEHLFLQNTSRRLLFFYFRNDLQIFHLMLSEFFKRNIDPSGPFAQVKGIPKESVETIWYLIYSILL